MNRSLARASYLIGATLILIPMFDATTSILPFRFAESKWRYGTIGLLSNSLLIPTAGLLILFLTAAAMEHRRTLRALGILAWIGCGLTALGLGAFVLDALQSQGQIRPEMLTSFVVASTTATVKIILAAVALALLAIGGSQAARGIGIDAARVTGTQRKSVLIPDARREPKAPVGV